MPSSSPHRALTARATATVCTGAETYAAKALFIDDAGRLVVEREGGRQIALQHGEVSIRPTSTI